MSSLPPEAHVPFIVRAPGLAPGRRADVVHHVDVFPTLLELAGLAPEAGVSGLALGPHLRNGEPLPERMVYCDMGSEVSGYDAAGFTRVYPADDAGRSRAPDPTRSYLRHPWQPGSLAPGVPADEAARTALAGYLANAVAMVDAEQKPEARDRERLRALGYLD